jgi:hypothetical protein
VSEYDALYAFSGAYPPVLEAVSGLEIKNINAMYNSQYYWRDSSRSAPHNLFTKSELLSYALRDKDLEGTQSEFRGWYFEDGKDLESRPDEQNIRIEFSSGSYEVEYEYDKESNSYLRYNGGVAHEDSNTSEQLKAMNVVITRVPAEVIDNEGRLGMDVTGEGEAIMFSNGEAFMGTWKKSTRTDRTIYYHEDGTEHKFVRGQTWVEVVPPDRNIEYN